MPWCPPSSPDAESQHEPSSASSVLPVLLADPYDVEVHTEDTNAGVVPGTEIDVLLDTETEVAGLGEVLAAELVLLDLEAALEDLLGLGAADGDVHGDLLVTTDAERSDGEAGLGGDGCLAGELFEHLGGSCQTIARLADGDVWIRSEVSVLRV